MRAAQLAGSGLARDWLQRSTRRLDPLPGGAWAFSLSGDLPLEGSARWEDEWLLLHAAPAPPPGGGEGPPRPSPGFWQALLLNGGLEGRAKLAYAPRRGALHLAAELPCIEGIDMAERLEAAFRGFRAAARSLTAAAPEPIAPPRLSPPANPPGNPPLCLPALCGEAGWPYLEREDGRLFVELEAGASSGFHQAVIEMTGERRAEAWVEVACLDGASPASREASGLLLLTASRALRLARPVVAGSEGRESARFQVMLPADTTAEELTLALGACTLACRLCAEELRALKEETIALEYLRRLGAAAGVPPPGDRNG